MTEREPSDDGSGRDSTGETVGNVAGSSTHPDASEPAFREPALDEATAAAVIDDAFDGESDSALEGTGGAAFVETDGPADEPEPEEALSQPLAAERDLGEIEQLELREVYGRVRAFFKTRSERYRGLQRRLQQARIGDTYDEYLTESVEIAGLAALVAGITGGIAILVLAVFGRTVGVLEPVTRFFGTGPNHVLSGSLVAAAIAASLCCSIAAAGSAWAIRNHYYPRSVVAARRRSIALNLPYAITFMYALSSGGMNVIEVCRRLGDSERVYGEVANEFDLVVREIDLFGNDLLQALDNVRTLTPSDDLRRFLDDLLGVLESGGDLETFLEEEAESSLDDALEEQASFIETLGVLSETFVVAFVAAPLFVIVVLMVVSFLGAETVDLIAALVYVVFPLAMVGFLLVVDLLSRPFEEPTATLATEIERTVETEAVAGDPRFAAYQQSKRETGLRAFLADPFRAIRRRPVLSLGLTAPAGVAVAGIGIWTGFVEPSVAGFIDAPLRATVGLVVAPLVTATGPLMILHERERRRTRAITERFPDVLRILASANQMGVDVVDAFELVTRWTSGTLADELRRVRNDVAWNHDLTGALLAFADRLHVPQLTRTMTLVAEGSRSSGDLHGLLEIAAENTRAQAKLARARRREIGSYVAIVVVGFLVYLLVIVMISASYLAPIAELAAGSESTGAESPVALGAIPVGTYEVLFLHSALIQGLGSGLIAGKLADNDVLSGLKYGLGLVALTVVAFFLLV
ncbi:type II secretion system F family protein [Natrinema sp. 1APR25-10V2]|uniref:type II secretion system F family protein n=1 Tax=Natrinema sp. 1APR25-10V2 TaxID=2951081 RepID=UPI0028770A17|nr:type II secretion system F family protein [Natrinema sp. 1APR25-10V2]MDS0474461.1 type II secretion system F family protein [Natrinema sp. 1APR25-10V2]